MDFLIHILTEPDHVMYAVAVVVMALGNTNRRWFYAFALSGMTWVVLSHIFLG